MLDQTSFDPRELRDAFGCMPTGVCVVTLADETDAPTGVTVGSFSSLSLSPALCLFSLGREQASLRLFDQGSPFVVNVLSPESADIAWQFAKPLKDKCEGVALAESPVGIPRLRDGLAYFACRTHAIHDGGDHVIIVGEILDFGHTEGEALVFHKGQMKKPAIL